ncbi:hypothetical protein [Glycomyces arizonensis]|uniref:hypothetical protein n=1 Tax=Glycomyces arizonensis TaxID=256035 RepID=UPI0004786B1A|nr:hypothetical protein [Glycomyces arizonensis]
MPEPAPTFGNMPGLTKAAVVLMWILFGFGACGAVASLIVVVLFATQFDALFAYADLPGIPPALWVILILNVGQLIVWTILRGVFAVRICRRDSRARTGAVVLEAVGLGLTVLTWIITAAIGMSYLRDIAMSSDTNVSYSTDFGGNSGSCVGIVLSILVIVFLSMQDSKRWCDR